MKKKLSLFLTFTFLVMSFFPVNIVKANTQVVTKNDIPSGTWPNFIPYTNADGKAIYDPASEPGVSPIDTDITSGVDRGVGNLPSVYVASDGSNFFVRFRLKGDPRDTKGGYSSSVWEVQLGADGQQVATVGLNGKPTFEDYVYVANSDGTNVQPIYVTTTPGGENVPGTRVSQAENGQYFLDFQVPIARVTEIAPNVNPDSQVKLFYGTSRAANLSVINKEWMQTTNGDGNSTNFNGLSSITLKSPEEILSPQLPVPAPLITIDSLTNGQSSTQPFSSNNIGAAGTTSLTSGIVTFQLNGNNINATAPINSNGTWSLNLSSVLNNVSGTYLLTAKVTNSSGATAKASKSISIDTMAETSLSINGGGLVYTANPLHSFSGTAKAPQNGFGNNKVAIYIDNVLVSEVRPTSYDNPVWTYTLTSAQQLTLLAGQTQRVYNVEARWTNNNGSTIYATAKQTLIYMSNTSSAVQPLSVAVGAVTGDAQPSISGTSTGAEYVEVQIDGTTVEITTPDNSGHWSVQALEKPLATGTHTITAIAKKGNEFAVATKAHIVTAASITIDNGPAVTLNNNTPTLRGNTNAPDSSDIAVTIRNSGNTIVHTTTVSPISHRWKLSVPTGSSLSPDGIYTVTTVVNGASAVQSLAIDTGTYVTVLSPAGTVSGQNTLFNGNTEPGATVNLVVRNNSGIALVRSILADNSGNWHYTHTGTLTSGIYTLTATSADKYGNEAVENGIFDVPEAIRSYSVTFDSKGGSDVVSQSVEYNGSAVKPGNPTKVGYTFDSWFEDNELTSEFNFANPITAGKTLYAKWTANTYTINFDAQDGTVSPSSKSVTYGSSYGDLPTPTREGHSFEGWYTDVNAGIKIVADNIADITSPQTLYARWTKNSYTISFDSNGGSGVDSQSIEYNGLAAKPENPLKIGYTFDGWYTDNELTTVFNLASPITKGQIIYAKWRQNVYTVTFDSNGGSAVENQYIEYNDEVLKPVDPTKAGFSFDNWYTDNLTFQNVFNFLSSRISAETTLYAKWTASNYTVAFDSNGGSTVNSQSIEYNGLAVKPENPVKIGYTFDGWYTDNELTAEFNFENPITEGQTLYAKWAANHYTVAFDSNGGSAVNSQSVEYNGSAVRPENPTKAGYTFESWFTDNMLTTEFNFTNQITAGKVLYAKWTANNYLVNFYAQGGTVSPSSKTVNYGSTYGMLPTPNRTGYAFNGWYTDAVNGTKVVAEDTVNITVNQTLYARWIENNYDVTFDAQGGMVSPSGKTVTYGSAYGSLPTPTREGYTFTGWYTDASAGTEIVSESTAVITETQTLYARWTKDSYTITFDSKGGSGVDSQSVEYNGNIVKPENPVKIGYTFDGWFVDNELTIVFNFTNPITEGQIIYAKWRQNVYTITFDSNGGSEVGSQSVKYNDKVSKPSDPTKTGYTFNGWFTDSTFTSEFNFADLITEGRTLYAKWEASHFTVTFDAQGGTVSPSSKTVIYASTYGELPTSTREGYTFVGWYSDPVGGTKVSSTNAVTITAAQTLYARWTLNSYTVIFDSQSGTGTQSDKTVDYGSGYGELPTPTKEGYTFVGWYTDSVSGTKILSGSTAIITTGQTLYARWAKNSYTVTFDSNGGSTVSSQSVGYNDKAVNPANPTKTGYTFNGWFTDSAFTAEFNFANPIKEVQILYAKWTANSYTVTFNVQGGTASQSDKTVTYGSTYGELPTPTREGYTFEGWYTGAATGTKVSSGDTVTITATQTLYSRWREVGLSDEDAVRAALRWLTVATGVTFNAVGDTWESVSDKLVLINKGIYDTSILWTSSKSSVINVSNMNSGMLGTVTRPADQEAYVVLTANVSKGGASGKKTFLFIVKPANLTKQKQNTRVSTDVNATIGAAGGFGESSVNIKRTFFDGGDEVIDTLIVTVDSVKNAVDNVVSDTSTGKKTVIINMTEPTDPSVKIKSQSVEIPAAGVQLIADKDADLKLNVGAVTISVNAATLKSISGTGTDLFFNVRPINDNTQRNKLSEAVKTNEAVIQLKQSIKNGEVVLEGLPYAVETNYTGFDTKLVVPFTAMTIPTEGREAFLSSLKVYIEHTDGTKEVVGGTIVYKDGAPVGIQIDLNKFSNFQIISVKTKTEVAPVPQNLPKTGTFADFSSLNAIAALFILAGGILVLRSKRKDEKQGE